MTGMTAVHTVRITCECPCAGKTSKGHNCQRAWPPAPTGWQGTARSLRADATKHGWEAMRGNHGRDVCGPCRIVEITALAGVDNQAAEASPR